MTTLLPASRGARLSSHSLSFCLDCQSCLWEFPPLFWVFCHFLACFVISRIMIALALLCDPRSQLEHHGPWEERSGVVGVRLRRPMKGESRGEMARDRRGWRRVLISARGKKKEKKRKEREREKKKALRLPTWLSVTFGARAQGA